MSCNQIESLPKIPKIDMPPASKPTSHKLNAKAIKLSKIAKYIKKKVIISCSIYSIYIPTCLTEQYKKYRYAIDSVTVIYVTNYIYLNGKIVKSNEKYTRLMSRGLKLVNGTKVHIYITYLLEI